MLKKFQTTFLSFFTPKINHTEKLPQDILRLIFTMLGTPSLLNCAITCKKWYKTLHSEAFLKQLKVASFNDFCRKLTDVTMAMKIKDNNAKSCKISLLLLGVEKNNPIYNSISFNSRALDHDPKVKTFLCGSHVYLNRSTYRISDISIIKDTTIDFMNIIKLDGAARVITVAYVSTKDDILKYKKLIYPALPTVLIFYSCNPDLAKEDCVIFPNKFEVTNEEFYPEWKLVLQKLEEKAKEFDVINKKLSLNVGADQQFPGELKIWKI
jgi:hypothetical protein